jgi:hypothetical protein
MEGRLTSESSRHGADLWSTPLDRLRLSIAGHRQFIGASTAWRRLKIEALFSNSHCRAYIPSPPDIEHFLVHKGVPVFQRMHCKASKPFSPFLWL